MIDLVSDAVGGRVVSCNDEFFADAANLIKPEPPVWREGEYTDRGKWMDGWESRRRREPGHDWCVLALGVPGVISRVTVDTSHFTGNYPEQFSLDVCGVGSDEYLDQADWTELIAKTKLRGDAQAFFDLDKEWRVTHVRFNIYPDGGVARLRIEGDPVPQIEDVCPEGGPTDLASARVGGVAVDASDSYFSPPSNMLLPFPPRGMWDGWETKRRRGPGFDWAVFRLGLPGLVEEIVVDTRHFKGNAPGWVSLHVSEDGENWTSLIDRHPVEKHHANNIVLESAVEASFIKLDIHPDGGVARFRALGSPNPEPAGKVRLRYLNTLLPQVAARFFESACASGRWVDAMLEQRPFDTVANVVEAAGGAFGRLGEDDWIAAFEGHPRIGEKSDDEVAGSEQAGALSATAETRQELVDVNRLYEEKFGFTYIVYATGKNATEMLEMARARLDNSRNDEIEIAAGEQRRITATRLKRMLCQEVAV